MNPTLSLFPDALPPAQPPAQERGTLQVAVNLVLRLDFPGATMDQTLGPDGKPTLVTSKETQARIAELVGRLTSLDKQEVLVGPCQIDSNRVTVATLHGPRIVGMHLSPELPLQEAPTGCPRDTNGDGDCGAPAGPNCNPRVAGPLEPQTPAGS